MNKKYELTDESITYLGHTLYRIQAIKDFGDVKKGDLGGYIESESNLSHEGLCWVYDDAKVYNYAKVYENAKVKNQIKVHGFAHVYNNAQLYDNARVFGNAKVYDYAAVFGNAKVSGQTHVFGHAEIHGDADIYSNAIISEINDYQVFKNTWSSGRYFTYTKSNNMWKVGCFYGTGEELIKKAYQDSELSGKMYEKYVNFVGELEKLENLENLEKSKIIKTNKIQKLIYIIFDYCKQLHSKN